MVIKPITTHIISFFIFKILRISLRRYLCGIMFKNVGTNAHSIYVNIFLAKIVCVLPWKCVYPNTNFVCEYKTFISLWLMGNARYTSYFINILGIIMPYMENILWSHFDNSNYKSTLIFINSLQEHPSEDLEYHYPIWRPHKIIWF